MSGTKVNEEFLKCYIPGGWTKIKTKWVLECGEDVWFADRVTVTKDVVGKTWVAKVFSGEKELFSHTSPNPEEVLSGAQKFLGILLEVGYRSKSIGGPRVVPLDSDVRVETGALQFNQKDGYEDWPGVFIRGDGALYYAYILANFLDESVSAEFKESPIMRLQLEGLLRLLQSCSTSG